MVHAMKVRVACPNTTCGKSYEVEPSQLGSTAECKKCGQKFTLEATKDTAAGGVVETRPQATPADPPPSLPADAPQKLGRFEIRSSLGAGGFGAVYRAYDPVLEREVALKVPRAAVLEKPEARARFLREPKAAARLQHPHIVPVFDAGTDGENFYIASAFIAGQTLQALIATDRPDLRQSAQIVHDIAEALHYAHGKGIVHRDVKPANIMIDADGQALLMDFGIAHVEESQEQLTHDGSIIGTPTYMAPEQADRSFGDVGPHSDQYALGVVLYELLCGDTPFTGPPNIVIYNLVNQEPTPPRAINAQLPRDLETICLKAMAKRPTDRYADCGVMADDLRRFLADEPIIARRMGPLERLGRWCRKNPVLSATALAASLCFLLTVILLLAYLTSSRAHLQELARRQQAELQRVQLQSDLSIAQLRLNHAESQLENAATIIDAEEAKREVVEAQRRVATVQARLASVDKQKAEASQRRLADTNALLQSKLEKAQRLAHPATPPIEPDLIVIRKNSPLNPLATVRSPATIPGVLSWTIETVGSHSGIVDIAYSPDDKQLAALSYGGVIRLWDAATRTLTRVLVGGEGNEHQLDWSPDGRLLAVGGGYKCHIWDTQTGRLIRTLPCKDKVTVAKWSPDGILLACGSQIWDARVGEFKLTLPTDGIERTPVSWSPDAAAIAFGDSSKTLRIFDFEAKRVTKEYELPDGQLHDIAWSPTGGMLAAAHGRKLSLWQLKHDERFAEFTHKLSNSPFGSIAWHRSGQRLFAVEVALGGRIWDLKSKRVVWSSDNSGSPIGTWSHDGKQVTLVSDDDIRTWDLTNGRDHPFPSKQCSVAVVTQVEISPDGHRLAKQVGASLRIASLKSSPETVAFSYGGDIFALRAFAWSPDSLTLAVALTDGRLQLFDMSTSPFSSKAGWQTNLNPLWHLAWSPDGKELAGSGTDSTLIWSSTNGKVIRSLPNGGPVAWSPDGKCIISRDKVWDTREGAKLHQLAASLPPSLLTSGHVSWSPDSGTIAMLVSDGVALFDRTSGHLVQTWKPGNGPTRLAWNSGQDRLFALACNNVTSLRLESSVSETLYTMPLHNQGFSEQSGVVASYNVYMHTSTALWELETGRPLGLWLSLPDDQDLFVSADGHFKGNPRIESLIRYVVQTKEGQQTLTCSQFEATYGWQNDPGRVRLGVRE
jgi:serine/threonine protein kinase/WD40 repeat protein